MAAADRALPKGSQQSGEIAPAHDCAHLASFFWIGWEGAILRAKLELEPTAIDTFASGFFTLLEQRKR
ncbi:hypothetical protein GCM10027343_43250 [Noviherbaspirillum agri]